MGPYVLLDTRLLTDIHLGKLSEEFTGFFRQGAEETEAVFTSTVNKYVYVTVLLHRVSLQK